MPEKPIRSGGQSRLWLAALVPTFYFTEWLLVVVSATLFAWLRSRGFSSTEIWLVFWAGNLAIAIAFIHCNDRLGVDITLMQALRRWTEVTAARNLWVGRLLECAVCIRLLLWEGPCQLLVYLRQRLSAAWQLGLLVIASGIQMFIWVKVYTLGCGGISDLVLLWKGAQP